MICCVDSSIYWVTRLYQLHEWHELYINVPQSPIYMPQIHEVRWVIAWFGFTSGVKSLVALTELRMLD